MAMLFIALSLLGITAACHTAEDGGMEMQSADLPARFVLELSSPFTLNTRGARTAPVLSGIPFNDVWVLQFNSGGTDLLAAKNYSATDIQAAGGSSGNYLVIVPTGDGVNAYFVNDNSRFYILVNAGEDFLGKLTSPITDPKDALTTAGLNTESSIKSLLQSVPAAITTDPGLLIDGPVTFQKNVSGGNATIAVRFSLARTYSRIDLKYKNTKPDDGKFTPTEAVVVNRPTHLSLFPREGAANGNYPVVGDATADGNRVTAQGAETPLSADLTSWDENTALTFYMGENLRGSGSSTTYAGKNVAANGPGATLNGCTHLILRGTYYYRIGYEANATTPIYSTDGISIEYKIYLGGNLTTDYNIRRNTLYDVLINIAGANSADARVTITDGNVIVFDDSETIENKVDFN